MLKESNIVIIRTTVPVAAAQKVRWAMGEAGAGKQGNYAHCSISVRNVGRFLPLDGAHPAIGSVGKLQEVEEESIEVPCRKDLVGKVILALKKAHPYEEPVIDIIPRLEL